MKEVIKKVLERYSQRQLSLESEKFRNLIADEIVAILSETRGWDLTLSPEYRKKSREF
jgi:hypothetical protein